MLTILSIQVSGINRIPTVAPPSFSRAVPPSPPETSYPLNMKPLLPLPQPCSLTPGNHHSPASVTSTPQTSVSCEWEHTVFVVWWMAHFTQQGPLSFPHVAHVRISFLKNVHCVSTTFCWIHPLEDTEVASTCWLLWILPLWSRRDTYFSESLWPAGTRRAGPVYPHHQCRDSPSLSADTDTIT